MMNCCLKNRQHGFTLVELLMVAFMLGLVMVSLYSLYTSSQRHAYIQEDVADVQQNLRVAVDSITRDVRNAGFLFTELYNLKLTGRGAVVPAPNGNSTQTIRFVGNNAANSTTLPATRDVITGATATHADILTLNVAAPTIDFARVNTDQAWTAGAACTFTLSTPESVDLFRVDAVNPDYVRILDPVTHTQSTNDAIAGAPGTVYQVTNKNRVAQTIQLTYVSGNSPLLPNATNQSPYKRNAVILKIASATAPYPTAVTYCLGPTANCPPAGASAVPANSCNPRWLGDPTMCLLRIENNITQVVASGISGLQFTYLLDTQNEVPNAITTLPLTDLTPIRAIRVNITGQTASTQALTRTLVGTVPTSEHVRSMTSIIKFENRFVTQ